MVASFMSDSSFLFSVPVYLTTFQVFCAVFFLFEEDLAEELLEDVLFPAPERVEEAFL